MGDPAGLPLIYLHPFAASRLQRHRDDGIAAGLGLRLIAPDRPGVGGSDRLPGRRVIDFAYDLEVLADELQLGRLAILGWSAGGAYALASGFLLRDRVLALGLASPATGWFIGPGAQPDLGVGWLRLRAAAVSPAFGLSLLLSAARRRRQERSERFTDNLMPSGSLRFAHLPVKQPIGQLVNADLPKQPRTGGSGVLDEALALAKPWGFDPGAVETRTLLWHGELDPVVSAQAARQLATRLRCCRSTLYPKEGHHLLLGRWEEILGELAATARGAVSEVAGTAHGAGRSRA